MTTTGDTGRSDQELLAAVETGDREAFRALYERHVSWLLLRLARRCGDPGMVDEVVQDTFLAVWKRPSGYRGTGEVAAWIWGIGIRRLIDHLRRAQRQSRVIPPAVMATTAAAMSAATSAEEAALAGVEHGGLAGALNTLAPELRAVVEATVIDGLTTREAARLLGIPAGTVKTRMMRAKPLLREGLL